MVPHRSYSLLAIGALALLTLGWWLGQRQGDTPPIAAGGPDTPAATPVEAKPVAPVENARAARASSPAGQPVPVSPGAAVDTPAPLPLPPPGTRLADVYDELLERARRGDARAACRLAADLGRCRNAPMMPGGGRGVRRIERRIARIDDEQRREAMIDMVATAESWREQAAQVCDGLTEAQLSQAFALQVQAATALPELRLRAVLQPAVDHMFPASDLEQWQQYRQLAQPWLEQAAAEGDMAAIMALVRVHGDARRPSPPWPPYRDIDDGRLVTYATLLERYGMGARFIGEGVVEAARARLDPAALRRAEDRAQALYRPEARPDEEARGAAMDRSMPSQFEAPRCD
jgi:hypothetical protein